MGDTQSVIETLDLLANAHSPYTVDQLKASKDAILMWEAGPVNPSGVSMALTRAIQAEFHATDQMEDMGPAVVIINNALQNIINRKNVCYSYSELFDAIDACRARVTGTEYEWPQPKS
jgi:hypothetical protein